MRQLRTSEDLATLVAGDLLWIEVLDDDGTTIVKRDYARIVEAHEDGSVTLCWEPELRRLGHLDGFFD